MRKVTLILLILSAFYTGCETDQEYQERINRGDYGGHKH